jgi:hypothetical protein
LHIADEIPGKIARNANVPNSQQLADFAPIFRRLSQESSCEKRECLGQNCLQEIVHMLAAASYFGCREGLKADVETAGESGCGGFASRADPSPSAKDFACGLPLRSRPQCRSKCNEALSRDLWPLDPFESAPMRATSSGMGYCILCANPLLMETKDLAELLREKAGSNSLPLKKLLCESC